MKIILLNNYGGGNWTPLLLPLIVFMLLVIAIDYLQKIRERKKIIQENELIEKLRSKDNDEYTELDNK